MTTLIVEALQQRAVEPSADAQTSGEEPSLESPKVGNPISHGQIVDLWKALQGPDAKRYSLENLLKGSGVHVTPPPPKPEPVSPNHRGPYKFFQTLI